MTVLKLKQNIFVNTFITILHNWKLIVTLLQPLTSLLIFRPSLSIHLQFISFIKHCNRLEWSLQRWMEAVYLEWEVYSDGTPHHSERVYWDRVLWLRQALKKTGVTRSLDALHASWDQIDASSHVLVWTVNSQCFGTLYQIYLVSNDLTV
jgi:hypothetical protein